MKEEKEQKEEKEEEEKKEERKEKEKEEEEKEVHDVSLCFCVFVCHSVFINVHQSVSLLLRCSISIKRATIGD